MTSVTCYPQGWPTTQNLSPIRKVARLAVPSHLIWLEVHPMDPMGEDRVSSRARVVTRTRKDTLSSTKILHLLRHRLASNSCYRSPQLTAIDKESSI